MKIKVLFNSLGVQEDLSVGWGLSFLIDNRVLFDTGSKGEFLKNNINKLKVDCSSLESVVISHDHWDHTGGLLEVLKVNPDIKVYGCSGFSVDFKSKMSEGSSNYFEIDDFSRIATGIYTTGEMIGTYKGDNISEQALIIKTEKGVSVVTGCAHPGIIKILEKVKSQLSIKEFYAVFGGFHLKEFSIKEIEAIADKFIDFKVNKVGATHCSGDKAEKCFQDVYKDNFLSLRVGDVVTI